MVKNSGKTGSPSRIRFVMVEAELGDGDIGQITLAIQNALRGPATTVQRIAAPTAVKAVAAESQELDEEIAVEEDVDAVRMPPAPVRQRGPRKPAPTPRVVDIDFNKDPSLESFVGKTDPKSGHKRYLII